MVSRRKVFIFEQDQYKKRDHAMKMTRNKGRGDFTKRLIDYAIEGGVLARCPDHAHSIYRTDQDLDQAHAVIEAAWAKGEISSGLQGAIEQLNRLVDKAPHTCSYAICWSKD